MKITPVFFGDRLLLQVVVLVDTTKLWSYEVMFILREMIQTCMITPSILTKATAILSCIRELTVSNLG